MLVKHINICILLYNNGKLHEQENMKYISGIYLVCL